MDVWPIVELGAASLGLFPCIVAAWFSKYALSLVTVIATILACARAVSKLDTDYDSKHMVALNALMGFVVSAVALLYLQQYDTCRGAVRTMWILTLVFSSHGYTFLKIIILDSGLINTITFIFIVLSLGFLIVISTVQYFCKIDNQQGSSITSRVAETSLIVGAFLLRFSDDLAGIIGRDIGDAAWHVCSWVTLTLVGFPR